MSKTQESGDMGFFSKNDRGKATPTSPAEIPVLPNRYADTPIAHNDYPSCSCFREYYSWNKGLYESSPEDAFDRTRKESPDWSESAFHIDPPSHSQRAWDIACEILEKGAKQGLRELNLGKAMDRADFMSLTTLPDSISEMKDLEKLVLYGSNLSSIPRAIAGCKKLKTFEPYTSYRLHWFPYEMKHCQNLVHSCISTRALYGNYKLRPPFPDLFKLRWSWSSGRDSCSICGDTSKTTDQFWTSQRVGSDVIPLLASVCGEECLGEIGHGAEGYLTQPHKGGLSLVQPEKR